MFDQFFSAYKSALSNARNDTSFLDIPKINKILAYVIAGALLGYLCTLSLTILTSINLHFISSAFLTALLIMGVISIFEIDKQMKREDSKDICSRKMEIEVLVTLCNQEVFALNGGAGLEWLIFECQERLDNSAVGQRNGSAVSRIFDRLLYPIIAFVLGQITNQLIFVNTIGNITIIVVSISMVVLLMIMVFPLAVDLLNRDKVLLGQLLEDLRYIKGSRYMTELPSRKVSPTSVV